MGSLIAVDGFGHDLLALCAEMDEQGCGYHASPNNSSFSEIARQSEAGTLVTGLKPFSKQVGYMIGN